MAKRDYYEVLGVDKGASADEIKKAYRKLAINTIPIETPTIQKQKKSLKKLLRLMMYCTMNRRESNTISLALMLQEVVSEEALAADKASQWTIFSLCSVMFSEVIRVLEALKALVVSVQEVHNVHNIKAQI